MKVRFSTPCLNHAVSLEYLMSALATEKLLIEHQIKHDWANRPGDPFIAKARSSEACEFLASDATDLFFLDDDIGWPAEKVLAFLKSDAPVIAGVYPHKLDELSFPCSLEADGDKLVEKDGLYRAVLAPTGFMRIRRWVIEKVYEAAPPYKEKEANGQEFDRRAIFNSGPSSDGLWWGEDYSFCNSCRANGIEVWIDPDIPFYHRGHKRWGAKMAESIDVFKERAAAVAKQTSEAA